MQLWWECIVTNSKLTASDTEIQELCLRGTGGKTDAPLLLEMKEQIPELLPGFREKLSLCLAGAVGSLFSLFWPFFYFQWVGAVQEGKYKLSDNVAQLFLGEMPTWGRRGTRQRLAHLLAPLGLRCCWVFSYLRIGNSGQTLQGEGCGSPHWLWTLRSLSGSREGAVACSVP